MAADPLAVLGALTALGMSGEMQKGAFPILDVKKGCCGNIGRVLLPKSFSRNNDASQKRTRQDYAI